MASSGVVGLGVTGSSLLLYEGIYRTPFLTKLPGKTSPTLDTMQKDMLVALEIGRRVDVPLPTTAVTGEFLGAARGRGSMQKNSAVLFQVLAHLSGLTQ